MRKFIAMTLLALVFVFSGCKNELQRVDELTTKAQNNQLLEVDNPLTNQTQMDLFLDNSKAYTYKAKSYIFIRMPGPFGLGHVGCGYEIRKYNGSTLVEVKYYFGAVENPNGQPSVPAGQYNGGWWSTSTTGQGMYNVMKSSSYGYTAVKYTSSFFDVTTTKINNAYNKLTNFPNRGYNVTGNNCMNAAYDVLKALGTPNLQWPSTNWFPKDWYNNHKTGWSASISPIP